MKKFNQSLVIITVISLAIGSVFLFSRNITKVQATILASDNSADSSQIIPQDHIHQLRGTPQAQKLIKRLKGKILLQVENKGEAYYVAPDSDKVYYLKDGPSAYETMKDTGLGISENDYNTLIGTDNKSQKLRQRLAGRIVLRVQNKGQAYYINPETSDVTYMANGNAAYNIMSEQGLGISDADLGEMVELNQIETPPTSTNTETQIQPIELNWLENIRITNAVGGSVFPAAVWTGSEYGLTWSDERDGGEPEIYFVRIKKDGTKIGSDLRITEISNRISYFPAMVWTGSEYGIVWSNYSRYDELNNEGCYLYFSKLNSNGIKQGENMIITTDNYGECPSSPAIVWTGSEFGIVWSENRLGTEASQIYFKKLNAEGQPITADIKLTQAISSRHHPIIVWTGNEFGIVWEDTRDAVQAIAPGSISYGSAEEIYFIRVDRNGNKITNEKRITNTPDSSNYSNLHWDGTTYNLFWIDNGFNAIRNIYFTKLDASGNKILDDIQITFNPNNETDYSSMLKMVSNGSSYGLTWAQGDIGVIKFVKINNNGLKEGSIIQVSTNNTQGLIPKQARDPFITWVGDKYGIYWMDTRDQNTGEEIYFSTGQ